MGEEIRGNNCSVCDSPTLREFVSFGRMPVVNAYPSQADLKKPEYTYNLSVGFCEDCEMVQLMEKVPYIKYIVPDETGRTHYAYVSSMSSFMQKHFVDFAHDVETRFLEPGSRVMEVGSNDGILLKGFSHRENVLGIEPSQNVAEIAQKQGIETLTEFFSRRLVKRLVDEKGKFRAVLSANVFLNILDIHDFMRGVNVALDDKGVFITEDPYLPRILENTAYDQMYDAHGRYHSLRSLDNLFEMYGMEIFDAQEQWVHGGSMRVYAARKGTYPKTSNFKKLAEKEEENGLHSLSTYNNFSKRVEQNKEKLVRLLTELKSEGKKIVGYAAAAKSVVVHNYCGIGTNFLDYVCDSTPEKQGKYMPGTKVPIVSPDVFHRDHNVDYALLGAWNHSEEILGKEKGFLSRGGKFIVHLPEPRIL